MDGRDFCESCANHLCARNISVVNGVVVALENGLTEVVAAKDTRIVPSDTESPPSERGDADAQVDGLARLWHDTERLLLPLVANKHIFATHAEADEDEAEEEPEGPPGVNSDGAPVKLGTDFGFSHL